MSVTTLSVRFDIDTLECVSGLPVLLRMGRELGVNFSFYANLGRSVSLSKSVREKFISGKESPGQPRQKLPLARKMSAGRILATLLVNPPLGGYQRGLWQALADSDHEVGLHGGRNHALWQAYAHAWTEGKVREEVQWGVEKFCELFGRRPEGFASPGWNSPVSLAPVLRELGFSYYADAYGPVAEPANGPDTQLPNVNTNLLGMPGEIGYFEYLAAGGQSAENAGRAINEQLAPGGHNVVYDHPGFISRGGELLLRRSLEYLMERGVKITSIGDALRG